MSELIAEARVLVTPDTTAFRGLLTAELVTATKGLVVPVTVTPVVASGAAASQTAQIAGANAATESAQRITSASATAAATQAQLARSADLVAVAERRAAAAATAVSAAQIRLGASISATEAAQRAFNISLRGTDVLLQTQAAEALVAARSNEVLAASNLQTARSEAAKSAALSKGATAQAASLSQLSRGAGGAGLAMFGLRGATLAATAPFLVGAAAITSFAKSIQLATSFNSEIAVLGATTGATAEQMNQAAEAARAFGRDISLPGVTAGDAAKTITEFSKAGLSLNDSIAATRGGLQLAQAAQLSYADAVTLSANALNAFQLSGNQAVHVSDVLANAANLAQGGIEDTALALRQAASAAQVVGVSFEDTTALLTLLAKNGLTGSDAGTALRTAFLRLVNPSKQAAAVLKELNVQLRDAQGNVRPEVFADFANAQRDLSTATQQANAAIVFGQDAFRAFGVLGTEGTKGLNEVRSGLDQTGTAAKIAQARMTGLAGAQENLSNQLSSLGLTVGTKVTPQLVKLVNELAAFAAATNTAIGVAENFGSALTGIADSATPDFAQGFLKTGFVEVFKTGNIVGQALRVRDLINRGSKDVEDEAQKSGLAIRDALEESGRQASRGAESFADQITNALHDAFALVNSTIANAQKSIRAGQIASVGRAGGQAAGLQEQFDAIVAGGGSLQAQIANLKRQAQVQAKIIANAGPNAAGVLLEARREAQAKLAQINGQIVSIENQIASDQKAAQDEAARIREDAKRASDQAFLQTQEDARSRQGRLVDLAGDTEGLQDDIRRRQGLRTLITQQISALRASAVDEKTKQDAIKALVAAKQATSDEINKLVKTQAQQNKEQQAAAQEERESAQIALGESILDLTGNKNPLLKALDAAIKDAVKERNAAKKGSLAFVKAQTEINNLLKQRKDLLNTAQDAAQKAAQGFSGFEFLQKTQGFASNLLGNLIPGFATGGLVGNTSAVRSQITDPGPGLQSEIPFGNQIDRGVRPVQVDTTNALLRQILATLNGAHTNPVEIRRNRFTSDAVMDTI